MTVRHNIVVFTGAGISAESGISTFRDKEGLWSKYDSMRLASIDGFREDPEAVLEFYNARRMQLYNVSPNHAHYALAELEKLHNVTVITKNVDDLHERAGSSKVIHLHGELAKVTSSREREDDRCIKYYPLNLPIRIGAKADDGSQLRPYIVWFGEYLRYMDEACALVESADIFVVIGTLYFIQSEPTKEHYMAMAQTYFLIGNVIMTGVRAYNGFFTTTVAVDYLYGFGGVIILMTN